MNMTTVTTRNLINQLSQEDLLKIQKAVLIDDLKDEYKKIRKDSQFDLQKQINKWLSFTSSSHTRRVYLTAINIFLKYNDNKVLDLSIEEADGYIQHLKRVFVADKTAKVYLDAVSSFYSHLARYSYVSRNPFRGTKVLIKDTPMKKKVIPTDDDIKALREELKNNLDDTAYIKMDVAIKLMDEYGVRKGFLENMSLSGEKLSSLNKGKIYSITLKKEDIPWFEDTECIWKNIKSETVVSRLQKTVNKLVSTGKIKAGFSAHCFRHKFALEFYKRSNHDIYTLKILLNHSSVVTTEKYLRGLNEK